MFKLRAVIAASSTVALLACCALPATAGATETATLQTSFSPDRLGASTTIGFGFQIATPGGGLPAPLTSLSLNLPAGIDYVSTTLGLAICTPSVLRTRGPSGCPPNSLLGSGSALVEVPFGTLSNAPATIAAIDSLESEIVAKQQQAALPIAHHFDLVLNP